MISKLIGSAGFLSSGGTIGGDLTISGDLTVTGGGTYDYSEVITGDIRVQKAALSSADYDSNSIIIAENDDYAFFQTASGTKGGLFFGDASSAYAGGITYEHTTSPEKLSLRAGAADRMIIDTNSRISLGNNDSSGAATTTIFGYQAGNAVASGGINNVLMGYNAGLNITSGSQNVAIGANALDFEDDGGTSVAVGYNALTSQRGNGRNVAVGNNAAKEISTGDDNVAIGHNSMQTHTTGSGNIAIGAFAMDDTDSAAGGAIAKAGTNNILVGRYAGSGAWDGTYTTDNVIGIGAYSLYGALGGSAADVDGTIGIGGNALQALTSGGGNLAIGMNALKSHTTGHRNIAIGHNAMDDTDGGAITSGSAATILASIDNIFIGYDSGGGDWCNGGAAAASNYNVAIGNYTMDAVMNGAIYNTALGHQALTGLTSGTYNTVVGSDAADVLATGDHNVVMGANALGTSTAGEYNVAIGSAALFTANHESNDGSIAIGRSALQTKNSSGSQFAGVGLAIGYNALKSLTTGTVNLAIGHEALQHCVEGEANLAIGHGALGDWDADTTVDASGHNVMIGRNAGGGAWETAVSQYNVGIGNYVMDAVMNGATYNTALGHNALSGLTSGDYNVALGSGAGQAITADSNVVAIGYGAYNGMDTADDAEGTSGHGSGNIAIGYLSMASYTRVNVLRNTCVGFETMTTGGDDDAQDNVALGFQALKGLTTGDKNTSVGSKAGDSITTGTDNVAIGYQALTAANSGESNHVAIGSNALAAMDGAADGNVAIGSSAGAVLIGESGNVIVGHAAMSACDTGTGNIVIGQNAMNNASADVNYSVVVGHSACQGAIANAAAGTVAVGANAFYELTSGTNGVAVGLEAGKQVATGNNNTCLGNVAGQKLGHADADNNVFVGYGAGAGGDDASSGGNNSATNNVGVGTWALGASASATFADGTAFTGTDNIAVGNTALKVLTSGTHNTAVGGGAGIAITSALGNTLVGINCGAVLTTGSYNTLIGRGNDVASNSVKQATSLGNEITGLVDYETRIGSFGALKYMTGKISMNTFTNAGTDNIAATVSLLKIPQYGFLKRVTCTVVTASGGTGVYNISLGNTSVSAGTALDTQLELIGVGAADGNGTTSRTQAADAAGDTNLDIVTAKYVHIWEANQATDNCAGWADVDKFLYVCHAGTANASHGTNAVLRITAEYWGED